MPKQTGKISIGQQEALVSLMESNSRLFTGKLDNSFTKKDKDLAWNEVAENLNSMFGAKKDVKSWMKTWGDMKGLVKKKSQADRVRLATTGNPSEDEGEETEPMTPLQMRIADLLGPIPVGGHLHSTESAVGQPVEVSMVLDIVDMPHVDAVTLFTSPTDVIMREPVTLASQPTPSTRPTLDLPDEPLGAKTPENKAGPSWELNATAKNRKAMTKPVRTTRQRNRLAAPMRHLETTAQTSAAFLQGQKDIIKIKAEKNDILLRIAMAAEDRAKTERRKVNILKRLSKSLFQRL